MPDKMSQEKIQLLRAFGARVIITPTAVSPEDPRSYYSVAERLVQETPNSVLANQYHNPENPQSHYLSTGPEIWKQTNGRVTDVVIGMGTGGTITGVGRFLKEKNPEIQMVGVDPVGSILLETWRRGGFPDDIEASTYKVEGIGEDFLPSTLDLSVVDKVITVNDKESFLWARRMVKQEGIFCGGSSGSAIAAALKYAQTLTPDHIVVVLLPDSGSRYLSKVFDDKWMRENGFLEATWSEISIGEILALKPYKGLISIGINDRMIDVIALMKENDISQVPALDAAGNLAGIVREIDLLNHMLATNQTHSPDETVAPIVQDARAVYPTHTLLEEVLPEITDGHVVLVLKGDRPIGILTKIDILDYIAQEI
jgi:cystathionine beta-synthase